MNSVKYDIVIVGGGLVGSLLAAALADTPLSIALTEAKLPGEEDHRLLALTHASCELLQTVGVWPAVSSAAAPINGIHVSQKGRFGMTRLSAADVHRETLGAVIPAATLCRALADRLATQGNLHLYQPARVTALQAVEQGSLLSVTQADGTGCTLQANVVLAADGMQSALRTFLGIPADTTPSLQKALVTVTHLKDPHQHIAHERFHQTGALAMLPLADGKQMATIWTDLSAHVDTLMTLSDEDLVHTLQNQMGYRLGRFLGCETRHAYPLQWMQVAPRHQRRENVLLLGNAAHTLPPIAAQGLNLALREIAILAEHFAAENAPHSLPNPASYHASQRSSDWLSRGLTHLFAMDFLPVNILRQAGLLAMDLLPLARKQFLKFSVP